MTIPSDRELPASPSVLRLLQQKTDTPLGLRLREGDSPTEETGTGADARTQREPAGRYRVLSEIGRGGVGIVYRGRDEDLGREVAMKVLHEEYATHAEVLARFVEEAQIGGQLQHPGIVPVYELGLQPDGQPFFAMKLIKGETLAAQLATRGDIAEARGRFLGIFEQICQTMAYAHARRVVHRDLKPANVMIGAFGEVQVVDWGFAKVLQKAAAEAAPAAPSQANERSVIETVRSRGSSESHSVAGSMFGTPAYMPPEQARGDVASIDERSDVFALGAMLCEILTGEPPYREKDGDLVLQAARAELRGAQERLARCKADQTLIALANECLAASARARPSSAAVVADRMRAYLSSVEERAREAQVRAAEARLRHRVTLWSAAAALLVLSVGAGGWIWSAEQERARRNAASQRIASARIAASGAQGRAEAGGLDLGLWTTAVESAEHLVAQAQSEDIEDSVRGDAEALLAAVQTTAQAARAEADRRARDARMLEDLEVARIPPDEDVYQRSKIELRRLDGVYSEIFARYAGGTALFALSGEEALVSMRRGDIEIELAAALDHWSLVRDELASEGESVDPAGTTHLRELATLLDAGDPWRSRLRALLPDAAREGERLRELAESADLGALPAVASRVLGEALWISGEHDAAVSVLRRALELHPRDFDLCFSLALDLESSGGIHLDEAIEVYRIARSLRPEQDEVLHRQVLLLDRLHRFGESERLVRLLLQRDPEDGHWHFHLGILQSERGDFEEAIACYRRALELDAAEAQTHRNLSMALGSLGRRAEAFASIQRALELNPRDASAHHMRGFLLSSSGQSDEAIESFHRAIELDPLLAKAHMHLGVELRRQRKPAEALPHLRRGLELDPRTAGYRVNVGNAFLDMGELEVAIEHFRSELELHPRVPQAHRGLGIALAQQGRLQDALPSFRRAVELDLRDGSALMNLMLTLRRLGQLEEALQEMQRAEARFAKDDSPSGREWLSRVRSTLPGLTNAIERATAVEPVLARQRTPSSSAEWAAAARSGCEQKRHADVVALTEATLAANRELTADDLGFYFGACAAAALATGTTVETAAGERARLRELARSWLELQIERWDACIARGDERADEARRLRKQALTEDELQGLRGAALEALPAEERTPWRSIWTRIEAQAAR
jgi:tetratricopeptide (TPR) repeat protein